MNGSGIRAVTILTCIALGCQARGADSSVEDAIAELKVEVSALQAEVAHLNNVIDAQSELNKQYQLYMKNTRESIREILVHRVRQTLDLENAVSEMTATQTLLAVFIHVNFMDDPVAAEKTQRILDRAKESVLALGRIINREREYAASKNKNWDTD